MSLKAATLPMGAFVAGDISSQSFTAMSVYYGFGLGCAYSFFDDIISLSLGGRYVMARRYIELDVAFASGDTISGKYTYNAYGFTPIAGLNIRPVKDLNIGFRYEYETALKFRYKEENFSASNGTLGAVARGVLANAGIKDGNSFNYNLPQTFGMGVEYSLTPEIALMTSVNISLLSLADMGKVYDSGSGAAVCELNDYCGTGWELSLGAIWKPVKERKIGTGFLLTEMGLKDSYFDNQYTLLNASANPPLDCIGMTLGANWIMENLGLDFTVVCSWIHYLPRDYEFTARGATAGAIQDVSGTYKKDVVNLGLGLGYKV
jgi:long-subunit fatty acid transport protein